MYPASEMTYTVSGGALNYSIQSNLTDVQGWGLAGLGLDI